MIGEAGGVRARRAAMAAAGLLSFCLYAATVCPTVPPGDGGELVTASAFLGVAHPPGYPLYTALAWLAMRPGVLEPALVVNLLSALAAALCCAASAGLAHRATGSFAAALAGALALAGSSTLWSVATVAEVYALHLLLVVTLLTCAWAAGTAPDDRRRVRGLALAGLVLGLGLAHHPTIVLVLPAAVILAWPRARAGAAAPHDAGGRRFSRASCGRGLALGAAAAIAIPALSYLWLLQRARSVPEINWNHRRTFADIVAHATAANYRMYDLGWAGLLRGGAWRWLAGLAVGELTLVALPFVVLGFVPDRRGALARRLRWALAALAAMHVAFGLRYSVEDAAVYLAPAWLALALAASLGLARLLAVARGRARVACFGCAALVALAPAVAHFRQSDMRSVTAARDFGRNVLASLGQRAVLVMESDQAFPALYLHYVLGERPDIAIYGRDGVLGKDLRAEVADGVLAAATRGNERLAIEQAFVDAMVGRPDWRPVHFMTWPGYGVPPRYRLAPAGLTWRVAPAGAPADDGAWPAASEAEARAQAERTHIGALAGIAAAYPLARAARAQVDGRSEDADAALDEAARVADGRDALTHARIGVFVAGVVGNPARAVSSFERALALQPASFEAWNDLGQVRRLAGDAEGARRAWRRSLELAPDQPAVARALDQLGPPRAPSPK